MIKFGLDKNQQYCKVCRLPEQDDLQIPDGLKPILKVSLSFMCIFQRIRMIERGKPDF